MANASLWQRLGAKVIDVVILVVAAFVISFFFRANLTWAIAFVPLHGFSYYFYHLYCHGKRGQTVGKRVMNIMVVRKDCSEVGFAGAFRRHILMGLQSVPWVAALLIALSRMPPDRYSPASSHATRMLEMRLRPHWYDTAMLVIAALALAELVSFLLTERRQTLSDLIGATVVGKLDRVM